MKCWGVVFEGSLKIKEEKVQNDSRYEIVDIGEYLPAKVIETWVEGVKQNSW